MRRAKPVISNPILRDGERSNLWQSLLGPLAIDLIREAHQAADKGLHLRADACDDLDQGCPSQSSEATAHIKTLPRAKPPKIYKRGPYKKRAKYEPIRSTAAPRCLGCEGEAPPESLWCSDACFEIWIDRKAEAVA